MKNYFLDISPKSDSGFCNQIYSIIYTCGHCVRNGINFIFLGKFLKEINSKEFCNISEILDLNATNNYLKQYNLCLIDYYNFDFKVVNAGYGTNNTFIDATNYVKQFLNNNAFQMENSVNLNSEIGNPIELHKNKYFIELDKKLVKLRITFSFNNIYYNAEYSQTTGFLNSNILIELNNVKFQPSLMIQNDQTEFTKGIFRNIVFKEQFIQRANEYIQRNFEINNNNKNNNNNNQNNNNNKKINCIHLRLEDDAVEHWAKENKMSPADYKRIIEDKYISEIKTYLKKEETTIVLSYNYDNRVVQFLIENEYNFILTQKMSDKREIAAIYDLHIGQHCNNIYILVYESSFSYTLLYRIYEQTKFKPIEIRYILNQRRLPA